MVQLGLIIHRKHGITMAMSDRPSWLFARHIHADHKSTFIAQQSVACPVPLKRLGRRNFGSKVVFPHQSGRGLIFFDAQVITPKPTVFGDDHKAALRHESQTGGAKADNTDGPSRIRYFRLIELVNLNGAVPLFTGEQSS